MTDDFKQLVEAAIAGDKEAFEEIVRIKHRDILYLAWTYCKNQQDAEDYAQEALILIHRGISSLREPGRFDAWMSRIVKNVCYSGNRSKKMRKKIAEFIYMDLQEEQVLEGFTEDRREFLPLEFVEDAEKRENVMEIINSLNDNYRECLLLYYYSELSCKEIADLLHVNQKKVENILTRARKQMKKHLEKTMRCELIYSAVPMGTIPMLSRLFHADAATRISPGMSQRLLSKMPAIGAGAKPSLAAAAKAGGASTRIFAGVTAVLLTAGAFTGVYFLNKEQPKPAGQPKNEARNESPAETKSPPAEPTEESIDTLEDMIGKEHADRLLKMEVEGTSQSEWDKFCADIGAAKTGEMAGVDEQFLLHVLEKQDKQLVLMSHVTAGGKKVAVKHEFGEIKPLPEMLDVSFMFD